jgi:hypothetical protein
MVALLSVVLLMFAAIAVDGGQAYAQRRATQNAADAAAMAGTRAVYKVRFEGASKDTVLDAVDRALTENGAEWHECYIINASRARISGDFCTTPTALNPVNFEADLAAGVEVVATQGRETFFAGVAGFDETTAKANAAATVQPFAGGTGSPFIVCGVLANDGWDIWDTVNNRVKPEAIGLTINLQVSNDNPSFEFKQCGAGEAFKGKAVEGTTIKVGEWTGGDNGNGFDYDIQVQVAGQTPCPEGGPFDGCYMLLPIASHGCGNGKAKEPYGDCDGTELFIVGWTVWQVFGDGHGNPKYTGTLVGAPSPTTGGSTTEGDVGSAASPYAIKLVE